MKYEYKIIKLSEPREPMFRKLKDLQEWFDAGWEYVDNIVQYVTYPHQSSDVAIVLRRKKKKETTELKKVPFINPADNG